MSSGGGAYSLSPGYFFKLIYLFIYFRLLFVAVCRFLVAVASLVAEHEL